MIRLWSGSRYGTSTVPTYGDRWIWKKNKSTDCKSVDGRTYHTSELFIICDEYSRWWVKKNCRRFIIISTVPYGTYLAAHGYKPYYYHNSDRKFYVNSKYDTFEKQKLRLRANIRFLIFPRIYNWKNKLKMIPVLVHKKLKKIAKISIFLCRVVSIFVIKVQQIHLEKYAYSFFFFFFLI